ncbi:hypothetical protein Rsub_01037 [Raphidocelis subcapitata]|uniref:Uncharacterized protein n=1 Tax=Raphidocelis subcapitata TaxID=307507 RepID=A0A2V0NU15_9CHLO|nr:hypothetical protein Rsub_01037 [Raphidocelis subcapitata]|eukprot:GBF88325.1 hypothetical protein Rsub_01037 [Raphidocelis subcapitata]
MASLLARSGSAAGAAAAARRRAAAFQPAAPPPQQHRAGARRGCACRALEASVAAAVSQQAVAYCVALGAEAAISLSQLPEGDKGRPQIPLLAAGIGGTAAAVALVSSGDSPVAPVGLALGLLVCGAMLAVNAKRAMELEYSDSTWPGPKAWPAGMVLISFFALSAFWQALFPLIFGGGSS